MTAPLDQCARVAVVGGGPAGLYAAERLAARGVAVDLYERTGSVGRKFLIAGKGGLNLTHSEPLPAFRARFRESGDVVGAWLDRFGPEALRDWARSLGVDTFVGSSGRVFPLDLKAGPLMRAWVRRLRAAGVAFHVRHRWTGWTADGGLRFDTPDGACEIAPAATVFALGGGSWAKLGSDGAWCDVFASRGIAYSPLKPANCGFERIWSAHFIERHAGQPVKPVAARVLDAHGQGDDPLQGEFIVTTAGIEGSVVYALAAPLREAIERDGRATLELDLMPGRDADTLRNALARPRGTRSQSEHWRRQLGLSGVRAGLLHELLDRTTLADPVRLAAAMKALPLTLDRTRPIDEAISTAGGVRFDALDQHLMLHALPGQFCAGEMLDWEAPTGGYLLTASFASGAVAADGVLDWLQHSERAT